MLQVVEIVDDVPRAALGLYALPRAAAGRVKSILDAR